MKTITIFFPQWPTVRAEHDGEAGNSAGDIDEGEESADDDEEDEELANDDEGNKRGLDIKVII